MSETPAAFNARNSDPKQIAQSFVKPDDFEKILEFQSKVLVGPRGIGKTTILKLLTPSGLYELQKRSDFKHLNLDHVPLYIPADTLWKGEASAFENMQSLGRSNISAEIIQFVQHALFVDYCLYEVIASVQDAAEIAGNFDSELPNWCIRILPETEAEICLKCSEFWELPSRPKSFLGLRLALLKRQNSRSSLINSLGDPDFLQVSKETSLDLFLMLRGFFDIMENLTGIRKWALHFDEMEIAPHSILTSIYERLRSFDDRAVIKFSLFPYIDFVKESDAGRTSPREGHDFETITLSGKFKNDNYHFASDLISRICEGQGIEVSEFKRYVNSAADQNTLTFEKNGKRKRRYQEIFNSLAEKDPTFTKYLHRNGIDITKIPQYTEKGKAPLVRKLGGICEFRNHYLKSFRDGKGIKASRKSYHYFNNYDQLLKLTEQNPRAIHFYCDDIIGCMNAKRPSQGAMKDVIKKNVNRFRALVATQVVPFDPINTKRMSHALDIVDNFGEGLYTQLITNGFSQEPQLAFKVAESMDDYSLKILGIAVNSGAIILDESNQRGLHLDLHGLRFRISYQLSPWYPLPTQTGSERKISHLGFHKPSAQNALFDWEE